MKVAPLALLLAGCAAWSAPTSQDAGAVALAASAPPGYVRAQAVVDIRSPWLSGTFQAAVAARTGSDPRVRLQLFPDLGGKALDLRVWTEGLTGVFPHSGETLDLRWSEDGPRHPLVLIGLTLLEIYGEAPQRRLEGTRTDGRARLYRLRPMVPGLASVLVLGEAGPGPREPRAAAYRLSWRGASWTADPGEIAAPDLRFRFTDRRLRAAGPDLESLLK